MTEAGEDRITAAVLAERERCAKIAEAELARHQKGLEDEWASGAMRASEEIATAIRQGEKPG